MSDEDKFTALLLEQRTVIRSISRSIENFKKIGKANVTEATVKGRLRILEENWKKCQDLHRRLQIVASAAQLEEDDYFAEALYEGTEDTYLTTCDFFNEWLGSFKRTSVAAPSTSTLTPTVRSSVIASPALPVIALPKFTGKPDEWEPFHDLFISMVHHNSALDDVQRLHYLKISLGGEAERLIRRIPTTAANYHIAWEKLKAEFCSQRVLMNSHLHAIVNAPSLKRGTKKELKALRDSFRDSLSALRNMQRPVDSWSDLLVAILQQKLNPETRRAWEKHLGKTTVFPSYDALEEFLDTQISVENAIESAAPRVSVGSTTGSKQDQFTPLRAHVSTAASVHCPLCSELHSLYACARFKSLPLKDRQTFVREHRCCVNCLSATHASNMCRSERRCYRCKRRHHTLLHEGACEQKQENAENTTAVHVSTCYRKPPVFVRCNNAYLGRTVLLGTANVRIRTPEGREERVRALIDPGAEGSVVSKSLAQALRVERRPADIPLAGLGGHFVGKARWAVDITIYPLDADSPAFNVTALVLSRVTAARSGRVPTAIINSEFPDLPLADAYDPGKSTIDLLIGADIYGKTLCDGVRQGPGGSLTAQKTAFGWIVFGPIKDVPAIDRPQMHIHHEITLPSLDAQLQKFWETEEPPAVPTLSADEKRCEDHFSHTHHRDSTGRYVVRLPFRNPPPHDLGYSRNKAEFLLRKLQARLKRSPSLANGYHAFLEEYEAMGHMRRAAEIRTPAQAVYIPHHAVLREGAPSTKIRVVFNASCPTSNGRALNDVLLVGPKLQADLPMVILRWRQFPFALSADISQMFRQILVDEQDVDFQRILWCRSPSEQPHPYQLLTVTYGTACAPYLANRVLKQLARDEGDPYPLARTIVERDFYVDDVLFGAYSLEDAHNTREELSQLLRLGGFRLHKWAASHPSLIQDVSSASQSACRELHFDSEQAIKILGLTWASDIDQLRFTVNMNPSPPETKRNVLSTIARLFDPLGWISPVIVYAKILLQEIWLLKLDWDEPLAGEVQARWIAYANALPALNSVRIPRWTGVSNQKAACELHGFADASSRAFGAAVYLKVNSPEGTTRVSLLMSKTKVAPLKTISIPRLELNAASLLAKIVRSVIDALNLTEAPIHCWTDSAVVLAWLRKPPSTWQTFVANRVSQILTLIPSAVWNHVASRDNPADCASRGLLASDIVNHSIWWTGPPWLTRQSAYWPVSDDGMSPNPQAELEARNVLHVVPIQQTDEWELPHRVSAWPRLLRVTAYCLRFINHTLPLPRRITPPKSITVLAEEIRNAELSWIKILQSLHYHSEMESLRTSRLPAKSPLNRLHVFLDDKNLLRVGGRLVHSALSASERHPLVLPQHRVTELLVEDAHRRTLHGGPQLTLRVLRQRYWILGARNLVRRIIHRCLICVKNRAATPRQLMADLPKARVTPHRPFEHCGVDYAGPVYVLPVVGRGQRARKAYISVFVCLSTRAVHLELVGDYSTEAFLAAFRRFAARRGLPSDMYSDNGSNFIGADNALQRTFQQASSDPAFLSTLASDGVSWHFIPPAAPHFGGLWEAGVKSVKHHLARVLGSRYLSIEEFQTLLTQIEACLNSRPIGPNTLDPCDTAALTPGHFLVGAPLVTVPEPSLLQLNENRLSRWQFVRRALEEFWKVWSHDYLHTLQQRSKWTGPEDDFKEGELVILRNPALPPAKWELGRIDAVYPGPDRHVRVVSVRTVKGSVRRPITQIVRLPIPCAP